VLELFPYTHICFAGDVLGELNNEIVLGAVFPDTVIAGFLEHAQTHQQCGEIYRYFTEAGLFNNFAAAAITHGTTPEGLDYYCDEKYLDFEKGYAFEMARPLVKKVVKCCRLPDRMGWWKAHNFVEMAAELWLYARRQEYHGYLARALDDRPLIRALSRPLASFYGLSAAQMVESFPIYGECVLIAQVTPLDLAGKYGEQTARKHGIGIDVPAAAEVIEEALGIVDRTFPEFFKTCRQRVRNLIKTLNNPGSIK
jgi:hypothetical protein